MAMAQSASETDSVELTEETNWSEFCRKKAQSTANDFAKSWKQSFIDSSTNIEIDPKDVANKFNEFFPNFLMEALHLSTMNAKSQAGASEAAVTPTLPVPPEEPQEHSVDGSPESPSQKVPHRPFFRRLSFKGLRKGKTLFMKQHSDEVELSPHHERPRSDRQKTKAVKMTAECIKDGIVHLLDGDTNESELNWVKCRMAVLKIGAGHVIEFYSPPKSLKPRTGIFCILINELRETTEIEMPDYRNTFVIKANSGNEWVVEAHDQEDMKNWMSGIVVHCTSSPSGVTPSNSIDPFHAQLTLLKENGSQALAHQNGEPNISYDPPPDLPPRFFNAGLVTSSQMMAATMRQMEMNHASRPLNGLIEMVGEESGYEGDFYSQLGNYPWFHGMLSRCDAATAVLQDEASGHGTFLVRQSETRKGEYVLTFNYQARAKHLRMTISPDGHCHVQHMRFQTIFDLLEHFRENAIPLESGGASDVTLGDFVIANNPTQNQQVVSRSSSERRILATPGNREFSTDGSSVRLTVDALERVQYENSNSGGSTGRAVDNPYTYT